MNEEEEKVYKTVLEATRKGRLLWRSGPALTLIADVRSGDILTAEMTITLSRPPTTDRHRLHVRGNFAEGQPIAHLTIFWEGEERTLFEEAQKVVQDLAYEGSAMLTTRLLRALA